MSKRPSDGARGVVVGREPVRATIDAVAHRSPGDPVTTRVLLVVGERGAGRTALLDDLVRGRAARGEPAPTVIASGRSPAPVIDRLADQDRGGLVIADDVHRLPAEVRRHLVAAVDRAGHRLVASAPVAWVRGRAHDEMVTVGAPVWLAPLTPTDVATLLGRTVVDAEGRSRWEASGGNPAILAALAAVGGGADRSPLADLAASWAADLDDTAARALVAAAVAAHRLDGGVRLDRAEVAAALGVDAAAEEDVAAAVDALLAADLLAVERDRPHLRLRHEALVDHWPAGHGGERAALAGRVVEHGRARRTRATLLIRPLAVHAAGTAAPGDAGPDRDLIDAAAAALAAGVVVDRRERVAAAEALVALTPDGDPRHLDRWLLLEAAHAARGDLAGVRRALAGAGPDGPGRARAIGLRQLFDPAPGPTPTDGAPTGPLAVLDEIGALYRGDDFAAVAERLDRVRPDGPDGMDGFRWLAARAWCGACIGAGDAAELVDAALAAFDDRSDADLLVDLLTAHLAAQAALSHERLAQAEAVAARCLAVAEAHGRLHLVPTFQVTLARARLFQGALDDAGRCIEASVDAMRGQGGHAHLPFALSVQAYLQALRGDSDGGRRLAHEILAQTLDRPPSLFHTGTLIFVAHTLATIGAVDTAADVVLAAGGGPDLLRLPAVDRPYGYEILVAADLADGRPDRAGDWLARARRSPGGPMARAATERAESLVAAAEGRYADAQAAATAASASSTAAGGLVEAARARLLAGLHRAAAGERDPATAELQWVRQVCAALGAGGYSQAAARQLRRLGRRHPSTTGGAALTDRESEVAALVASGLTNRQIAGVLFIGERTAEAHVARVLAKLQVSTRAGVGSHLAPAPPFRSSPSSPTPGDGVDDRASDPPPIPPRPTVPPTATVADPVLAAAADRRTAVVALAWAQTLAGRLVSARAQWDLAIGLSPDGSAAAADASDERDRVDVLLGRPLAPLATARVEDGRRRLRRRVHQPGPVTADPIHDDVAPQPWRALIARRTDGPVPDDGPELDALLATVTGTPPIERDGEEVALAAWWAHLSGRPATAVALAELAPEDPWAPITAAMAAVARLCDGDVDGGRRVVDDVLARTGPEQPVARLFALGVAAMAAAVSARVTAVHVQVAEAEALARVVAPGPVRAWALGALSTGLASVGDATRATAMLLDGAGGPDLANLLQPDRERASFLLVQSATAHGDRDGAARLVAEARRRVGDDDDFVRRARAEVALADGDPGTARDLLEAVGAGGRTLSWLDRLLHDRRRAVAWVAAGDPEPAIALLRSVEARATAARAERERALTVQVLRGLGLSAAHGRLRPTRSAAPGSGHGLTPRQLEVAHLVTLGRTNREIAEALSVSEKTVENHVSAVLQRLGVARRSAIAAGLGAGSVVPPL